jgi:hypothetical protein
VFRVYDEKHAIRTTRRLCTVGCLAGTRYPGQAVAVTSHLEISAVTYWRVRCLVLRQNFPQQRNDVYTCLACLRLWSADMIVPHLALYVDRFAVVAVMNPQAAMRQRA